jgi:hypothetical protein
MHGHPFGGTKFFNVSAGHKCGNSVCYTTVEPGFLQFWNGQQTTVLGCASAVLMMLSF